MQGRAPCSHAVSLLRAPRLVPRASCPAPRAPVAPQTDEDHGQSILNARVKALTTKKGTHTVSDQLDVIARRLVSTG